MRVFIITLLMCSLKIFGQNSDVQNIHNIILQEYKEAKLIVIEDSTSLGHNRLSDFTYEGLKQYLPNLSAETFENFKHENSKKTRVNHEGFNEKKLILLSKTDVHKIFKNSHGWETFYQKYPDSQGLLTLSNVGFNPEKTQALIYYGNQSHYLAGAGYVAFFEKVDGKWRLSGVNELWIS